MSKFILILVLMLSCIDCTLAECNNYCTPEVKEKGFLVETELECKLVQLTLDYVNLNFDFNIRRVTTNAEKYLPYYRTLTTIATIEEKPWNIKIYYISIFF